MSRKQVYNTEEPVSYLLEELPLEDDSSTDLESSDDVNVSLILYQMTMMLLKKAWRYCTFQPPFCYWWLIMKKRGWKLYRSPNTNPMGGGEYERAIAPKTQRCHHHFPYLYKIMTPVMIMLRIYQVM